MWIIFKIHFGCLKVAIGTDESFHFHCLKYLTYNLVPFLIPVHNHVSFSPDRSISFLPLLPHYWVHTLIYFLPFPTWKTPDYINIDTTHLFIARLFWHGRLHTTSSLTPFRFSTFLHCTLPLTLDSFSFLAFCDSGHFGEPHYWHCACILPSFVLLRISFSLLPAILISCLIFSVLWSRMHVPQIFVGVTGVNAQNVLLYNNSITTVIRGFLSASLMMNIFLDKTPF